MSERIRSMQLGVDKVLELEDRVAELEAENAKLRRYYEVAEEIRVTVSNTLAFRIDDLDAARAEVDNG